MQLDRVMAVLLADRFSCMKHEPGARDLLAKFAIVYG